MAKRRTASSRSYSANFPKAGKSSTTTPLRRNQLHRREERTFRSESSPDKRRFIRAPRCSLLHPYLHPCSIRQSPAEQLHNALAHYAFEFLWLRQGLYRLPRHTSPHPSIHGRISQTVRFLILFPERVPDRK